MRAFPMALKEVPASPVYEPEKEVRSCYTWRALVHFADYFGLAKVEPVIKGRFCREYNVKSLPLLQKTVKFHIPT